MKHKCTGVSDDPRRALDKRRNKTRINIGHVIKHNGYKTLFHYFIHEHDLWVPLDWLSSAVEVKTTTPIFPRSFTSSSSYVYVLVIVLNMWPPLQKLHTVPLNLIFQFVIWCLTHIHTFKLSYTAWYSKAAFSPESMV